MCSVSNFIGPPLPCSHSLTCWRMLWMVAPLCSKVLLHSFLLVAMTLVSCIRYHLLREPALRCVSTMDCVRVFYTAVLSQAKANLSADQAEPNADPDSSAAAPSDAEAEFLEADRRAADEMMAYFRPPAASEAQPEVCLIPKHRKSTCTAAWLPCLSCCAVPELCRMLRAGQVAARAAAAGRGRVRRLTG